LGPDAVASRILHAATSAHPRIRYKVTAPAHIGAIMRRIAPDALIDWIMAKQSAR
jgi:hypothetical protein